MLKRCLMVMSQCIFWKQAGCYRPILVNSLPPNRLVVCIRQHLTHYCGHSWLSPKPIRLCSRQSVALCPASSQVWYKKNKSHALRLLPLVGFLISAWVLFFVCLFLLLFTVLTVIQRKGEEWHDTIAGSYSYSDNHGWLMTVTLESAEPEVGHVLRAPLSVTLMPAETNVQKPLPL